MPEINQVESIEECNKKLLNYKLDEVLAFYAEDFGDDIADEIETQIILEIDEDNPEFQNLLGEKITYLWFELVNKVVSRLHQGLNKHISGTIVDFSDIIIELDNIKRKAREHHTNFDALKNLYLDDVDRIKIRVKSKLDVAKNIKKEKNIANVYTYGLAIFTLISGYILSKYF